MASPNGIAQLLRMKPGRRGAITQVLDIQGMLYKDAMNPETSAGYRAQVARAWEVLEERKRILRMKPKPKDIDVDPAALAKQLKKFRGKANKTDHTGPIFDGDVPRQAIKATGATPAVDVN
jgi:hypothetical protein